MHLNTGGSKVYELGFRQEKCIAAIHQGTAILCHTYRRTFLGSLPHQIKLLCLWGRRKKFKLHNTNVDAQLFRTVSLTFTGHNFYLQKVSPREQVTMKAQKITLVLSYLNVMGILF